MTTATLTYDLSIPEDAYDYKCALKGFEACLLLESLTHSIRQYQKHDLVSEVILQDMISQLREWRNVNDE